MNEILIAGIIGFIIGFIFRIATESNTYTVMYKAEGW